MRNCLIDEGRPLGTGLQEQVPNHLRRLWSKAMVVSAEGKGLERTRSGDWQEEDRKGTTDDMSKAVRPHNEFPPVIPQRVALQQSPPPLCRR